MNDMEIVIVKVSSTPEPYGQIGIMQPVATDGNKTTYAIVENDRNMGNTDIFNELYDLCFPEKRRD